MALPPSFLDQVRSRTPLASLIGKRVELRRSGKNWSGCCPFHKERTPSFYVYEDGYHCFGCGANGDAIAFVMGTRSLSYEKAIELLASAAGLPMPAESNREATLAPNSETNRPINRRKMVLNESSIPDEGVDAVLATAARILVQQKKVTAASILANATGHLTLYEHDNWNGGEDTWELALAVPAAIYFELDKREDREKEIAEFLNLAVKAVSSSDFFHVSINTALEVDADWRRKVNQHLSGDGITNQGRVRSDNIAAIECDGLLFRSGPEVQFYEALKRSGVPFAPLSVVLHGGLGGRTRRIEPDFIIYKDGMVMIVEIDGDLYHTETPAAAHARLKFLTDEGAYLERINASTCNTPEKAKEAVERVLATIQKLRRAR